MSYKTDIKNGKNEDPFRHWMDSENVWKEFQLIQRIRKIIRDTKNKISESGNYEKSYKDQKFFVELGEDEWPTPNPYYNQMISGIYLTHYNYSFCDLYTRWVSVKLLGSSCNNFADQLSKEILKHLKLTTVRTRELEFGVIHNVCEVLKVDDKTCPMANPRKCSAEMYTNSVYVPYEECKESWKLLSEKFKK